MRGKRACGGLCREGAKWYLCRAKTMDFMQDETNRSKAESETPAATETEHTAPATATPETDYENLGDDRQEQEAEEPETLASAVGAPLRPVPSKSRTTNIPPLMPAGFAPASPVAPNKKKKNKKKDEAGPTPHIGPLRASSAAAEPAQPAPQRRLRVHREPGFFRRHWWWMVLVVLLAVIAVSLPWTLPQIERWNGNDGQPLPAATDSDTVATRPAVQPVLPDTAGLAARMDSLRQDSIRRAAARAYWRQRRAAEEAARQAEASEDEAHPSAAAHTDSVH